MKGRQSRRKWTFPCPYRASPGGPEVPKRNIVIPAEMWEGLQRECGRETAATGRPISGSEWIRRCIRKELDLTRKKRIRDEEAGE